MYNSLLFVGWAAGALLVLLIVFRFFGKSGIMAFICVSVVVMNILVTKSIRIFGVGATGGNVLYAAIFLSTDILSEYYGGREARRAVMLGFLCSLFSLASVWITIAFVPAAWDWAQESLVRIFTPVARIVAGSMVAYLVSQNLDTYLYEYIRKRWKPLWLRNNGSTWTSQLVDTLLFCSIGLLGTMPLSGWVQVCLSTYFLKILVALVDTPYIYLSRRWLPRDIEGAIKEC
jgi:uncharacterized integral membrane protein (TIGR00697 family)